MRVQAKQYAEAVPLCLKALSLSPDLPEALEGLGVSYEELGQSGPAAEAYRHLIAVRPDMTFAYVHLGATLLRAGRSNEARQCLEQGLTVARRLGDSDAQTKLETLLGMAK